MASISQKRLSNSMLHMHVLQCPWIQWQKKLLQLCFWFGLASASALAHAQAPSPKPGTESTISSAIFVTDEWHELTRKDGTGMYFDLVRAVFERQGVKVEFRLLPYARAVQKVKDLEADGWVASFLHEKGFPIYPKYHFDKNEQVILFHKRKADVAVNITSLRNQRVAWLRDFGLDRFIKEPMRVTELDTIESAFQMLERDRIDYFVGAKSDIQDYIRTAKLDMSNFGTAYALHLGLYMAFANNERGKKLSDMWDTEMETFHRSDSIKAIYKKYGYAYPFP